MHTKCPECNLEFTPEELNEAEISRKTAIESLHIYKAESEQRGFEIVALKAENARYREALEKIYIPDPVRYDGEMAFAYKMIAREALRGE